MHTEDSISEVPGFPLCRIIREGTVGDCPVCQSTTIKKYKWFGPTLGCIQPNCKNYYGKTGKTNSRYT